MDVKYFEVSADYTGDYNSSFSFVGNFKTREAADKYCRDYEKENNYYPFWKVEARTFKLED